MVTSPGQRWLLLVYKVPPEPTAGRVAVWRRLRRLGAVLLHDAVWVLPLSARTLEEYQWLAVDVRERGGEALVWEASLCEGGGDASMVEQFVAQVDTIYSEIAAALESPEPDLRVLSKRYQQAKIQDYFRSPLGERVRAAILTAGGRTV